MTSPLDPSTGSGPALPKERGAIAPLRILDAGLLFDERAERFATLAKGHPMEEFLLLLARVARGQRAALRAVTVAPVELSTGAAPPLAFDRPRDPAWRAMLKIVTAEARAPGLPAAAAAALAGLEDAGEAALESLADAVLSGEVPPDRVAAAPFVGAALQAWFGALAAHVDPARVKPARVGCPVCGSPPVAGLVQGDDTLRYLACSLCPTQWHLPRIHCASCRANDKISYLGVEELPGVTAEACDRCQGYVKLFSLAKREGAEPLADDAATIALDLLVSERGYRRGGVNLLFGIAAGAPDAEA
ncbi:MAG TPA: formate dehydrogenase accessory protein FdhE [Anaeromyxobacteraceae bacterium]|nr:formate dehydrogenase accessory protein FdhE [Anaeromyxobacteraceae bacterium]